MSQPNLQMLLDAPLPGKQLELLIANLNGVGRFCEAYPQEEAVAFLVEHMRNHLGAGLRQKIAEHAAHGGVGMKVVVQLAVARLMQARGEQRPA